MNYAMKYKGEEKPQIGNKINRTPNALTIKIIKAARQGKGIDEPIKDIHRFIDSL
jgi:hypothetical protein